MHLSWAGCGEVFPLRRRRKLRKIGIKWPKFAQKWPFLQIFQRKLKSVPKFSNRSHLAIGQNQSSLPKIGQNDRKTVHLATLTDLPSFYRIERHPGFDAIAAVPAKKEVGIFPGSEKQLRSPFFRAILHSAVQDVRSSRCALVPSFGRPLNRLRYSSRGSENVEKR